MNLKFCFVVVTSLGRNREIFVFCIEYSFAGRSSHRRCFVKKGALKNFSNFTGKCLCWNLFLIKLQASWPATLLKRDSNASFFFCEIAKFWRASVLMNIFFTGLLSFSHYLTHLRSMFIFYTPEKYQKTSDFLIFSGGIKREHWREIGWITLQIFLKIRMVSACKAWSSYYQTVSNPEYIWDTVYSCYCKFRLVTLLGGGWGDENFWFWDRWKRHFREQNYIENTSTY